MLSPSFPVWNNALLPFQMLSMFGFDATMKKHPFASTKSAEKARNLYVLLLFINSIVNFVFSLSKIPSAFYTNEESCLNELYVSFTKCPIEAHVKSFHSGHVLATTRTTTMDRHSQTCSITKSLLPLTPARFNASREIECWQKNISKPNQKRLQLKKPSRSILNQQL